MDGPVKQGSGNNDPTMQQYQRVSRGNGINKKDGNWTPANPLQPVMPEKQEVGVAQCKRELKVHDRKWLGYQPLWL